MNSGESYLQLGEYYCPYIMRTINSLERWPLPDIMHIGSKVLRIEIPEEPVPQGRPRFSFELSGHAYDPERSRKYKKKVAEVVKRKVEENHWIMANENCPVKMKIVFYKSVLVSDPQWAQYAAELGYIAPLKKNGDIENLAKAIMDACTGIVYKDDCQIYSLWCETRCSFEPRTEVTIEAMFVDIADLKSAGTKARSREDLAVKLEEFKARWAEKRAQKKAERKERIAKEHFSAIKPNLPHNIKRRAKEEVEKPKLIHVSRRKKNTD